MCIGSELPTQIDGAASRVDEGKGVDSGVLLDQTGTGREVISLLAIYFIMAVPIKGIH